MEKKQKNTLTIICERILEIKIYKYKGNTKTSIGIFEEKLND
jgi:hypothetical protein